MGGGGSDFCPWTLVFSTPLISLPSLLNQEIKQPQISCSVALPDLPPLVLFALSGIVFSNFLCTGPCPRDMLATPFAFAH